jgi:sulfate adenylyltransferase subunit 2
MTSHVPRTPHSALPVMHRAPRDLESEAIHLIREVVAERERPLLLYSIGKDSAVLLHLARKAFLPARLPFPLLHIDTTWKFREMITFRDWFVREHLGLDLIVHTNVQGLAQGITPFTHGSTTYTDVMKTEALKQALDLYRCDAAFGGARRDEEKSRAKERIVSVRDAHHRWDPKRQRPEIWNLFNTQVRPGESLRVFPLSNWTELDVWTYIAHEDIPVVPLYFAQPRPIVERDGMLLMVDDPRMELREGESVQTRMVRFRTLGCYPLTGAVESLASSVPEIITELREARVSERQGRAIDHDRSGSMEEKKREGYF